MKFSPMKLGDYYLNWLIRPRNELSERLKFWCTVWMLYILTYSLSYFIFDRAAIVAGLIPLTAYACVYGVRWALTVALFLIPVNMLGLYILGGEEELALLTNKFWVGVLGMVVVAFVFGRYAELRKQIEYELKHSRNLHRQVLTEKNRAVIASQAKDDLLATVSHDLRTPISGIIQSAQLLAHDSDAGVREKVINNIISSGQQLLQMVNDLLDLYRQDVQAQMEAATVFDIRKHISDIDQLMKPLFTKKGLKLTQEVMEEVPRQLLGHPKLLRQTLFNLLGNSLKYTVDGGVRVEVLADITAQELLVSIVDTGVGIPSELIPAILDDSYRSTQVMLEEESPGNYGLGLRNCRRMVVTMKGEFLLSSEVGKGTTVTLRLPLDLPKETLTVPSPEPALETERVSRMGNSFKVLLVEDSESNIVSLTAMLSLLRCSIQVARTCQQAIDMLSQNFDLILLDSQLQDGKSDTVIAVLKEQYTAESDCPYVVIVTADTLLVSTQDWLLDKVDMILTKPVSYAEMKALMKLPNAAVESMTDKAVEVLNIEYLQKEQEVVGADVVNKLFQTFLKESPEYMKSFLLSYGKQDYLRCAAQAHKLCSAAESTGLTRLAKYCREVEELSRAEERIQLYKSLVKLNQSFKESQVEVAAYLKNMEAN